MQKLDYMFVTIDNENATCIFKTDYGTYYQMKDCDFSKLYNSVNN